MGSRSTDGRPADPMHRPPFEIASLFVEQVASETDLGRAKAKRHGVRLSPTIADALTLGTGKLAVDAVLLIAEHGDYPLQREAPEALSSRPILPRGPRRLPRIGPIGAGVHRQASDPTAGPRRPAWSRRRALKVPLMAGSSLPVTWRKPPLEIPLGRKYPGGAGRLAGRPGNLRLPRPGDAPVHGRAAGPRRQAAGGHRRDLPGRRCHLGRRRQGRLVVGVCSITPSDGVTPSTPGTSARTRATSVRRGRRRGMS